MDRAANCRDWQKPIDVKPQQSPKNEKLQSTWMNPYELCGPEGQSAWHPQGFVAGNGCSAKGDRATDRRDGPVQAEAKLKPSMTNEKFQSPLSRPNMSCGRKGQSEKRPYVTDTHGQCSL